MGDDPKPKRALRREGKEHVDLEEFAKLAKVRLPAKRKELRDAAREALRGKKNKNA